MSGESERWKALGAMECESAGRAEYFPPWNLSGACYDGHRIFTAPDSCQQEKTIEVSERYDFNPHWRYSDGCPFFCHTDNGGEMVLGSGNGKESNAAVIDG